MAETPNEKEAKRQHQRFLGVTLALVAFLSLGFLLAMGASLAQALGGTALVLASTLGFLIVCATLIFFPFLVLQWIAKWLVKGTALENDSYTFLESFIARGVLVLERLKAKSR